MTKSLIERFEANVMVDPNSGCWLWTAAVLPNGYGVMSAREIQYRQMYAHRLSYILHVGPIPEGLQIDHKCRTRYCVNPNHLEAVTGAENRRRGIGPKLLGERRRKAFGVKTHCPHGHEYTPENTRIRTDDNGHRHRDCKMCASIQAKAQWAKTLERRQSP